MRRGIAPLAPTWKKTHALCRDQRHVVATYSSAQVQLAYLTSLVNLSLRGGGAGASVWGLRYRVMRLIQRGGRVMV